MTTTLFFSPVTRVEPELRSNIKLLGVFLCLYAIVAFVLMQAGPEKFEHLHLLLDTSNGILSLLLAMFLMAEQSSIGTNVRKYLVIGFGFAAATEIIHALAGIEWSGWMAWATTYTNIIRPATWPPSAYVLPLALVWTMHLSKKNAILSPASFAAGMALTTLVLFSLSFNLPKYLDTGILGIQRPTQVPLLFLLLGVIVLYWRERKNHPLFEGVALMCVLLFMSDLFMLYSTSPHEKFTMTAHVGKLCAYALLHTIQMRLAADDSRARKQAELDLKEHRDSLELLVQERTNALQATEARASHLLYASADGLIGIDCEDRITFINPAGCEMLGYRAEDVIGVLAHPLFHHSRTDGTPYPKEECPNRLSLASGITVRIDNEVFWHADGHPIPVMYAMHPMLEDGVITGGVISFVDMTTQHAAAQAREQALIAAENLARIRSEFLSNMSHEIRTPLNGVLGFARIGQRNYENSEKALNAFTKILESGDRLLGVVNEILDFSKLEAGKMRIEHVNVSLHEVLRQSADLVSELARAKKLELSLELAPSLPTMCVSDPLRLGQILLNLLTNAVKFTEKGKIALAAERVGDNLIFSVTDTGIGMSAEQLSLLFNPFHQVDASHSRRFGGTGLGLAICKRLLELMEGEIWVESEAEVGSLFAFRVPYVQPLLPVDQFYPTSQNLELHGQNIAICGVRS